MSAALRSKYPFIVKWGQWHARLDWAIDKDLQLAYSDNAPTNAVYRRANGTWQTVEDLLPTVREQIMK